VQVWCIRDQLLRMPASRRPLHDALNHVHAEDLASPMNLPPRDNSAMDGNAVRGTDVAGRTRAELHVVETVPAGRFPTKPLGPGEATRIFTGAPLPAGADTVVRQEDTEANGSRVSIVTPTQEGRNVRHKGEDIHK